MIKVNSVNKIDMNLGQIFHFVFTYLLKLIKLISFPMKKNFFFCQIKEIETDLMN